MDVDDPGMPTVTGAGPGAAGPADPADPADTSATATRDDRPQRAREKRTTLPPGTQVGRYVVTHALARGGMGVVYRARDPELGRDIALKLVRVGGQGGPRSLARERLLREAQALALLAHPNVIAVHDVGTHDDDVFIAMELVEGASLRGWLAAGTRSVREIVTVLLAAGRGLAAAHGAGLVHRDFKPDNVMVGTDGRVRVLDFGLARAAPTAMTPGEGSASGPGAATATTAPAPPRPGTETAAPVADEIATCDDADVDVVFPGGPAAPPSAEHPSSSDVESRERLAVPLTAAGLVVGTPAYMAPEHHRGEAADALADQFSFCVTAWEALYGQRPFAAGRTGELRRAKERRQLVAPPRGARVPARLRRLLIRGLAPHPADRFRSIDALCTALARALDAPRRRLIGLAAMAALGGVATLVVTRPGAAAPACAVDAAQLAGVWDDGVRDAVRRAFATSGRPHAAETAARVTATLDAYVTAWTAMRLESCTATRRGQQSAELLDLRARCLDARRDQLRALTGLFVRSPDGELVDHAVEATQALPPLDACADATALRAISPPPTDPARRAQIDALRAQLGVVEALATTGKYADGRAQVRAVIAGARAVDYPPLLAAALEAEGELAGQLGDGAAAATSLREAGRLAAGAHDDRLAATALIELVWILGGVEARYAEAEATATAAEVAVARAGDAPGLRAALLARRGMVQGKQGQAEAAAATLAAAIAVKEAAFGRDDAGLAATLNNLGEVLRDQGQHAAARAHFERALAIAERTLGPAHPDVAAIINNLGASLWAEGRYDEARRYLERSLASDEATFGEDHARVAISLMNLGGLLHSQDRPAEARPFLERAVAIQRRILGPDHPDLAMALHNLAAVTQAEGDLVAALADFRAALAIFERALPPDHPHFVFTLLGAADVLVAQGQVAEAMPVFERALAIQAKAFEPTNVETAYLLVSLGHARTLAGRAGAAVPLLERAVALRTANPGDPAELAIARFRLAAALWAGGGDRARAVALARQARDGFAPTSRDHADVERWLATR